MFTAAEKAEIDALAGVPYETFKERVVIYKTPTTAFVASAASNFNFAFGVQQPAAQTQYVTQSGEFYVTIEYVDQEDDQQLYKALNTPLEQAYGDVRLSSSGSLAKDFLENCEKIVLDGKDFRRISDIMPRGMFSRQFFDCWLKKIDNG